MHTAEHSPDLTVVKPGILLIIWCQVRSMDKNMLVVQLYQLSVPVILVPPFHAHTIQQETVLMKICLCHASYGSGPQGARSTVTNRLNMAMSRRFAGAAQLPGAETECLMLPVSKDALNSMGD